MIPTPEEAFEILKEYNSGDFHLKHARIVGDCMHSIHTIRLKQQIAELRRELNRLPPGEDRNALLSEFMNLTRELAETGKKRSEKS